MSQQDWIQDAWNLVREAIRNSEGSSYLDSWLNVIKPKEIKDHHIILDVPSNFHREYMEEHYYDILFTYFKQVLNFRPEIKFEVNKALYAEAVIELVPEVKDDRIQPKTKMAARSIASGNLHPKYTFDSFVVGKCNEFAYNISMACAENPGKKFNPMFIAAGSGLGKTHLLTAIGHHILDSDPNASIYFISAEKFTNEVIAAIRTQNMDEFRKKYRQSCDVLLMDDIQFLSGKTYTLEEFFHTFNTLYDAHKQIIVTSDKPPAEIVSFEERIRTRFASGMIADIQPPELETRVAILNKKAEAEGIHLTMEVATYIASMVKSNIREMEGALCRVIAYSEFKGTDVCVELAKECLKSILKGDEEKLSIEGIQQILARHYKIKFSDLKGPSKKKEIAFPRQVAMYMVRKHLGKSFPEIGRDFGGRDHTTVMHACKKLEQMTEDDLDLRSELANIEKNFVQ